MTRQSKLIITILICTAVGVCLALTLLFTKLSEDKRSEITQNPEQQLEAPAPAEPQTAEASMQSSETEKYILKYNIENDTVYLITKKTDGTEIISPVESINPFYLTDEDLEALSAGIELTQREDMFILIEDFSS